MKTTFGISKAQANFPALVRSQETITILNNGEPVAVLMPKERMDMILETMEIMGNPKAMKAIRDYQAGKLKSLSLKSLDKELDALDAQG